MFVQLWIKTYIFAHYKKLYIRVGLINNRAKIKPSFPPLICIVNNIIVGEESVLLMSNKHILIVKCYPCWVTCGAKNPLDVRYIHNDNDNNSLFS